MNIHTALLVLAITWLAPFAAAQEAAQEKYAMADQLSIEQKLRSSDWHLRAEGMMEMLRIPREHRGSALNDAVVEALEAEIRLLDDIALGKASPLHEDDHFLTSELMIEVIALNDPATIPTLVRVSLSQRASRALADFGRQALPEILTFLDNPQELSSADIMGGLSALQMIVSKWGLSYFSPDELTAIKNVAIRYLDILPENYNGRNGGHPVSSRLRTTMDLAFALQDEALQAKVVALSKDEKMLLTRGAKEEGISKVTAHVLIRLAGHPPRLSYDPDMAYNLQALRDAMLDLDK